MNDATDAVSNVLSGTARIGTGWGVATMLFGALAIGAPFVTGVAVTAIVAVLWAAPSRQGGLGTARPCGFSDCQG